MSALMGAEYKVKLDDLKGTSVVDSEDKDNIRAAIQVGGIRKRIPMIKTYVSKSRSSQYVGGFDDL